jgi:hypothetical protein
MRRQQPIATLGVALEFPGLCGREMFKAIRGVEKVASTEPCSRTSIAIGIPVFVVFGAAASTR